MYHRTTSLLIIMLYIYNTVTHVNGQKPTSPPTNPPSSLPTKSPTTPTSSPTFIAPPFVMSQGAATITKFEMLVSNQVVDSAGSGETVYFDYVPAIGTTVTIRMTFNWDSSSSANLYCPGCYRQLLLGVERSHVNNACYSSGSGYVYTGLTLSVSYTDDGTPRHISTAQFLAYGCDDLINSIPSNKIGFISSTQPPSDPPSNYPSKSFSSTLDPTESPMETLDPSTAPTLSLQHQSESFGAVSVILISVLSLCLLIAGIAIVFLWRQKNVVELKDNMAKGCDVYNDLQNVELSAPVLDRNETKNGEQEASVSPN